MRESGHYWTRRSETWAISHWSSELNNWAVCGRQNEWHDSDFEEIDERILSRGQLNRLQNFENVLKDDISHHG